MARDVDIAIVGAGLAGSTLAAILGARGHDVALIDPHAAAPDDFRAEKLSKPQFAAFRRLGLATAILDRATLIDRLTVARFGEIVEQRPNEKLRRRCATAGPKTAST